MDGVFGFVLIVWLISKCRLLRTFGVRLCLFTGQHFGAKSCKIPDKIPTKNQRNRKNRKINERNKQEIEQNSPKELISTSWLRMIYFIYNHVWALDTEITFTAFRIIWMFCNRVSTTAYIETWNRVWAWCPHGFEKSRKLSHFFAVWAPRPHFSVYGY